MTMPEISYSKYDQVYTSMQKHDWKSRARCRRRVLCIRRRTRNSRETYWKRNSKETYWKAPDTQNVQDITETVMEERMMEEIPPNTWEQVPQCLSLERCEVTGESSNHTGKVWQQEVTSDVRFAYGISPKACAQWSLCRRSIAQSFKATAIGSVTKGWTWQIWERVWHMDVWLWR